METKARENKVRERIIGRPQQQGRPKGATIYGKYFRSGFVMEMEKQYKK